MCANYLSPYEALFNILTLFSKSLPEKLFRRRIYANTRVGDAAGVWKSLNWITVPKVVRAVQNLAGVSVSFDRSMLEAVLLRAVGDREFFERRSPWVRRLAQSAVRLCP